MENKILEIDKKIIKFLLSGGAYSDGAIIKNIGITYEELEDSYLRLLENGYLETYENYQKREAEECPTNSGCGGCKSSGCCNKKKEDYSDVKVITWKAIDEFQD